MSVFGSLIFDPFNKEDRRPIGWLQDNLPGGRAFPVWTGKIVNKYSDTSLTVGRVF